MSSQQNHSTASRYPRPIPQPVLLRFMPGQMSFSLGTCTCVLGLRSSLYNKNGCFDIKLTYERLLAAINCREGLPPTPETTSLPFASRSAANQCRRCSDQHRSEEPH